MANSAGHPPDSVGRVAYVCWWLGFLIALQALGFMLSAWVISIEPDIGWVVTLGLGVCLLASVAAAFRSDRSDRRSVTSYDQLPYSWGIFTGTAAGAAITSAGILGANLVLREVFYAQVSQVIPVLLLTFAVEQRFFTRLTTQDTREDAQFAFIFVMMAAAVAELLVLSSLASSAVWVHWAATIATAMAVPSSLALITVAGFVNAFRLPTDASRLASPV